MKYILTRDFICCKKHSRLVGSKIFSNTLEESIEASMLHSCFYCIKSANNFTMTAAKSTKDEIEQCM
jgi:hypothetical protein